MPVTPDERLAKIEQSLDHVCSCIARTNDSLSAITTRLEAVARLEERYISMDGRIATMQSNEERRLVREEKVRDIIFDRLRTLEGDSSLNSHGRDMTERAAIPLATAILGGLAVYTIKLVWGG